MSDTDIKPRSGRIFRFRDQTPDERMEAIEDLTFRKTAEIKVVDHAYWPIRFEIEPEVKSLSGDGGVSKALLNTANREVARLERELAAAIAERDAAQEEARQLRKGWDYWQDRAAALSAAQSPADGRNAVSAGDGGDGIEAPSTASLSAAVSVPKLGER